jgi:hypothetical protein
MYGPIVGISLQTRVENINITQDLVAFDLITITTNNQLHPLPKISPTPELPYSLPKTLPSNVIYLYMNL